MMEVPLSNGLVALVDDEDYDLVFRFRWQCHHGYAQTGGRHNMQMHRMILNAPPGVEVDHVDGNGLNNTRVNLRLASRAENNRNRRRHVNNLSGFKGVGWSRRRRKYRARVQVDGVSRDIGYFDTPEEADAACRAARSRLHGEFVNHG